jgi:hypothetical protein
MKFIWVIVILSTIVFLNMCENPNKAEKVYKKIDIGMSVKDVFNVLEANKVKHSGYKIKLTDEKKEDVYSASKFIEITNDVANNKISYDNYEASVTAIFVIVPPFGRKYFDIYFGPDGKVKSKSEIKSMD